MPAEQKLRQLAAGGCPVFYFYSTERYLVREACAAARRALAEEDEEPTVLDDAAPDIGQVIMAAGTISFFGGRRLVLMPQLAPAAYTAKDLQALCDALQSAQNAVFVLGSVFEEYKGKPKPGKQAQKLLDVCKKLGYTELLAKPGPVQLKAMAAERAAQQGAALTSAAAAALLERCGPDPFLLQNEVDKLCALAGYGTVTPAMVEQLGVVSLDADVFEMVRLVTAKNTAAACQKLHTLLRLRAEPVAIAAALAGSYLDMWRVKAGQAAQKGYAAVFEDFGYRGSDYRLKRAGQAAGYYTRAQLENCLLVLLELDQNLKSQPVDSQVQLETALCRLALAGSKR